MITFDKIIPGEIKSYKLSSILPYIDTNRTGGKVWCARLIYDISLKNGNQYMLEIPKVELPFSSGGYDFISFDFIRTENEWDYCDSMRLNEKHTYMSVSNIHSLGYTNIPCLECLPGNPVITDIKSNDGVTSVLKTVKKAMTLDEIERELGYSIEIVDDICNE